ncbi:isoprene synthase, chloroplastic-like isoform X2 [Malania oleifera]|uniref:isoprene synthase, chloroplastic-like isoform X2 n=1 Tax=Malania oleifera TaxID=397392 RepID=UPI0025AE216D|nr:isoprene synthase, chloroplastic-like isoform X2 [Malania oleifera]
MALNLYSHHLPPPCFSLHLPRRGSSYSSLPVGAGMKPVVQCRSAIEQDDSPVVADQRRSANYQPSYWSPDFVESLSKNYPGQEELYQERTKELEEKVRRMIEDVEDDQPLALAQLVDSIQRLGLGHRFEEDITRALDRVKSSFEPPNNVRTLTNLHATALTFRLLRQHGHPVPQDVFKGFMDHKGNFRALIAKDVGGLLSLYEASHLGCDGEIILEEAKAFTTFHLNESLKLGTSTMIAEEVSLAMEIPLHRRMPRLEARWSIELYQKREDANQVLLELAELDFNKVQSIHQSDLQDLSRWWKDMGLVRRLNFARDRLMESFFWTVGLVFEPQFSSCRKGLTKVITLITTLDDVYDIYGSLEELELFTDAVERWDITAVKNLPGYMKLCFLALYNTVNEMAYETLKEQGDNIIPHLAKAWANLCKAFLVEARWNYNKNMPTFTNYLENAWQSVSGAELERGESANSILCYMRETGLSEEFARKHINNMIDGAWKKINKARSTNSPFSKYFVEIALNLARNSQCTYQHGDGYGAPDSRSRNRVSMVIIEPIPHSKNK